MTKACGLSVSFAPPAELFGLKRARAGELVPLVMAKSLAPPVEQWLAFWAGHGWGAGRVSEHWGRPTRSTREGWRWRAGGLEFWRHTSFSDLRELASNSHLPCPAPPFASNSHGVGARPPRPPCKHCTGGANDWGGIQPRDFGHS